MADDRKDWTMTRLTPEYRQIFVREIAEVLQQFPNVTSKTASELEEDIFTRARDYNIDYETRIRELLLAIKQRGHQLMTNRGTDPHQLLAPSTHTQATPFSSVNTPPLYAMPTRSMMPHPPVTTFQTPPPHPIPTSSMGMMPHPDKTTARMKELYRQVQLYVPFLTKMMDEIEKNDQGDKTKNNELIRLNGLYRLIQSENIKFSPTALEESYLQLKCLDAFNQVSPMLSRDDNDDPYFVQAIAEGSGYLKPAVVVMHGPPGAGKTSVKQLLLGRPPLTPNEQNSTDILERPIRTCRVKSGGVHKLVEVNKEEFHQMLLDSVHAETSNLKHKATPHTTKLPLQIPLPKPDLNQTGTSAISYSEETSRDMVSKSYTPFVNPPSTHFVHLKEPTTNPPPRIDSSNTLKVMKKSLSTAKSSRDLFDLDWIYLVDSGGQPQFADIIPLLFQSEALYLVVIRLDQNLNDKQNSCYCSKGTTYQLPDTLDLTHYQMIERTCQIAEAQSSKTSPKQVVVIATRFDKIENSEAKVTEIDRELLKLHEEYEDVLVPSNKSSGKIIFPVNTMSTGAEREAYTKQLQQCLIDIVGRSIKPIEVPLKWFVYELDLDEESQKTNGVVKKSRCVELGGALGMTSVEIELSLKFFNRLALHLYHSEEDFPDLVLINMDHLTDRLSALIRTSFEQPLHIPTKECSILKSCGLFEQSYLEIAFKTIRNNAISMNDFLRIAQCLKVIVCVCNDQFFIPSALSVDTEKRNDTKFQHIPCVFNWKEYILPPGFFFTLIVMLLQQRGEHSENHFSFPLRKDICQSRDRIVLNVELYGGIVTFTNEKKWIWVNYVGGSCQRDYTEILKLVVQALEEVVNQFSNVAGIKFPYICFPCCSCPPPISLHPCSFNVRHDQCICTMDRSKMMPLTNEMKNIMEAIRNIKVSTNSTVREQRSRKRDAKERKRIDAVEEELKKVTLPETDTIDLSAEHSARGEQEYENDLRSDIGSQSTSSHSSVRNSTVYGRAGQKRSSTAAVIGHAETAGIKKAQPLANDVFKLLKKKSSDWNDIGRELNVSKNYRKGLEREGPMNTNEDKLECILEKWLESECSEVSWKHLIEVLRDELEWKDTAKEVEEFLFKRI